MAGSMPATYLIGVASSPLTCRGSPCPPSRRFSFEAPGSARGVVLFPQDQPDRFYDARTAAPGDLGRSGVRGILTDEMYMLDGALLCSGVPSAAEDV